jgi:hypothetical protein
MRRDPSISFHRCWNAGFRAATSGTVCLVEKEKKGKVHRDSE